MMGVARSDSVAVPLRARSCLPGFDLSASAQRLLEAQESSYLVATFSRLKEPAPKTHRGPQAPDLHCFQELRNHFFTATTIDTRPNPNTDPAIIPRRDRCEVLSAFVSPLPKK